MEIAKEIESTDSMGNVHVAEERNQKVNRTNLDEEDLYSGVLRMGADVAKATSAAPPSSSPLRVAAKQSKEDDTSVAAVHNDEG